MKSSRNNWYVAKLETTLLQCYAVMIKSQEIIDFNTEFGVFCLIELIIITNQSI